MQQMPVWQAVVLVACEWCLEPAQASAYIQTSSLQYHAHFPFALFDDSQWTSICLVTDYSRIQPMWRLVSMRFKYPCALLPCTDAKSEYMFLIAWVAKTSDSFCVLTALSSRTCRLTFTSSVAVRSCSISAVPLGINTTSNYYQNNDLHTRSLDFSRSTAMPSICLTRPAIFRLNSASSSLACSISRKNCIRSVASSALLWSCCVTEGVEYDDVGCLACVCQSSLFTGSVCIHKPWYHVYYQVDSNNICNLLGSSL